MKYAMAAWEMLMARHPILMETAISAVAQAETVLMGRHMGMAVERVERVEGPKVSTRITGGKTGMVVMGIALDTDVGKLFKVLF